MPRNGSGTYTQPFPDVVEGTTIESTVYNGFTNDVALDLNTARPISVGGTGADNAADAMNNLGGEGSKIEVTNYSSHNFTAGSFYSKASATDPPVASHAFAGICYVAVVSGVATSDMFIEVRDRDEATSPGSLYVRQKKNGAWGGWLKAVGTSMGSTAPASPTDGMFWWDPTRGKLFVWYSDPNTAQWVEAVAVPDVNADDLIASIGAHAVRYDVAQTLTPAQISRARANIDVTQKNYIINGAMMVSQENGVTNGTTHAYYAVDQFVVFFASSSGVMNVAQTATTTPAGSPYRYRFAANPVNASPAAGDYVLIRQHLEGLRVADLQFGLATAKTVTLQFGVRAPAGTYCVCFRNAASNRVYVAEYVISAGENLVDTQKSITVPGDVTGTWMRDNTAGINVDWILMAGANARTATAGAWSATNVPATNNQSNGASTTAGFELFDVSLTEGTVAPPFVVPDYASELLACQRYCRWIPFNLFFTAQAAGWGAGHSVHFASMRANPSATPISADPATTQAALNNASNTVGVGTPISVLCSGAATAAGTYQVTGYRSFLSARL